MAIDLVNDGNTEMWLYAVPALPPVDLTSGAEIPITDLSAGTFTRATNTVPSRLPSPGDDDPPTIAIVAGDNTDASITDNGSHVAFVSNRDLEPGVGILSEQRQTTKFLFHHRRNAEQNKNSERRELADKNLIRDLDVAGGNCASCLSNANNPIDGTTGGTNSDATRIFTATAPSGIRTSGDKKTGNVDNRNARQSDDVLKFGRRRAATGADRVRFVRDLANEHSGATSRLRFVYLRCGGKQLSPHRDSAERRRGREAGGTSRVTGFTDNDASGERAFGSRTRMNIKPDGTIRQPMPTAGTGTTRPTRFIRTAERRAGFGYGYATDKMQLFGAPSARFEKRSASGFRLTCATSPDRYWT